MRQFDLPKGRPRTPEELSASNRQQREMIVAYVERVTGKNIQEVESGERDRLALRWVRLFGDNPHRG